MKFEPYKNLSGNSSVASYSSTATSISIKDVDGAVYVFDAERAGQIAVDILKSRAAMGSGLGHIFTNLVATNRHTAWWFETTRSNGQSGRSISDT